ncbi:endo-1,4-beta-xylanase [Actinocrinis sp.]|uniref:endo-1,4-beta-xylanase n=1 Tax=Actinocrinis sp. TaxID=1920516 RepID=UPI002D6F455F|nr:endo-1,4-beta-xylanase [Actinocrinis sp.]HZP53951.1 endo-1,4-beta-xylanase [Actinocrinis sp.]
MDIDTGADISAGRRRPGPSGRRRLRAAMAAGTVAFVAAATGVVVLTGTANAASTLRAAAEADGRYFGAAVGQGDLGNSSATNLAATQFDMVTPENEMKWDTIEPSNGSYNFGPGDNIVNFATSHNERMRGHNLVWHSQLPGWVTSLPLNQVQSAMESHITTEVTHYKGKIYAWDVVNEPFNDDGSYRQDVFYNAFGGGEQYIADAIKTAHAADPNAKLYINDYNIEGTGSKSNAMYTLAQQLLQQGVPLSGIGFESHFIVGQVPSSLASNMARFTALGLDVAITELDDRMPTPASSANLQQQATDDANIVKTCLNNAHCPGVTQWNLSDADSWVPGTFSGQGAATLFDSNWQPKPAYTSVLNALNAGGVMPSNSASGSPSSSPSSSPSGSPSSSPSSSPSASPSSSPSASASSGGGSCRVGYAVSSQWPGGFGVNVTITNLGAPVSSWKLSWSFTGGQTITQLWNGTYTQSGGNVTVSNVSYNGSIGTGGSTAFGFNGSWNGSNPVPTGFTLNGSACSTS